MALWKASPVILNVALRQLRSYNQTFFFFSSTVFSQGIFNWKEENATGPFLMHLFTFRLNIHMLACFLHAAVILTSVLDFCAFVFRGYKLVRSSLFIQGKGLKNHLHKREVVMLMNFLYGTDITQRASMHLKIGELCPLKVT